MAEIENPIWHTLLSTHLSKRWVRQGLTIPYIIGAYSLIAPSYEVSEESIPNLLRDIASSKIDEIAIYHPCHHLYEDVVSLRGRKGVVVPSKENYFSNSDGVETLIVRGLEFKSILELGEKLNNSYLVEIKASRFSRDGNNGWKEFENN